VTFSLVTSAAVSVWAILAAAGSGERLGLDRPKAFASLNDRPLLAEPLERLDASEWIEGIVVAAPPEWEEPCILIAEEIAAGKVAKAVTGGATRSESVRAALAEVPDHATVVLVHDAARPLIADEVIERVITALGDGWDGAVPTLPIADTVKRVSGDTVAETLDREGLVTAQTPQTFVASILREAFSALHQTGTKSTDCASLVEANGGRVRAVEGDPRLLKVTTQADLELVESWL
jgi:2-C-methyl-D-erythritol 4-phosphate cytidylyltransferase